MAETADIVARIANVLERVRRSVHHSDQGRRKAQLDGWLGRDAHMAFRIGIQPHLMHFDPTKGFDEFEFYGAKFRYDPHVAPEAIIISHRGAIVRRIGLHNPELDDVAVQDDGVRELPKEWLWVLRDFQRSGQRIVGGPHRAIRFASLPPMFAVPPDEPIAPLETVTVDLLQLVDAGLMFADKRSDGSHAIGLTLMGRNALAQIEAAP